ncbi:o-succinylbenzoate--CoA ligase [Candidatus Symbiopectobacterium sp. NZEC135]|uniref:o-succinylbenzoate--CoA ligase n=1 Tax=Candidatus Symbiopectobacterium sp. NZEC135 TaxID=2820471 RepID=UPI0022260ED7|nr:o-succinylbenzoate--CoA ligase [Candidatus Symbiopectobacterium sp. NZEC135]MCW2478358.1 o-succinylbenzoate--CoA ligase [Candidatus Symbiopectobacterium sp. NZEC135]
MAGITDWPWRYWAARKPQTFALTVEAQAWSWQRLASHCEALAADFSRQGVNPDDIVALRGKNSATMLFSYLALLQCGARVLPLNPQLPASLLSTLLPSLGVAHWLSVAPPDDDAPVFCNPLHYPDSVTVTTPAERPLPEWQASRLATLTLTSGSSGLPKAAVHAFSAHIASAQGVIELMAFTAQDSWLLSLPLFHVSGQGIVWRWLTAGARLVLRSAQPLEHALQDCSYASLVPTQLWRLLAQGTLPDSLSAVLLGGAAIPLELTQQAEARGIRCWCGYGMTEMASTVCAKRADGQAGVGLPLLAREIDVQEGEILLRGDSMAAGYWRDGTLLPLTDSDGWFHTRDSGVFQHNEWHVLGRLDNQFFSGGEGIQPENIEALLLAHPKVQQACVVPVTDAEFGQRPVAVIDVSPDVTLAAIRDWLTPQLAGFQRPVAYYAMPADLHGGGIKIARVQVQAWAEKIYRNGVEQRAV